jgi:hypothetical protein
METRGQQEAHAPRDPPAEGRIFLWPNVLVVAVGLLVIAVVVGRFAPDRHRGAPLAVTVASPSPAASAP